MGSKVSRLLKKARLLSEEAFSHDKNEEFLLAIEKYLNSAEILLQILNLKHPPYSITYQKIIFQKKAYDYISRAMDLKDDLKINNKEKEIKLLSELKEIAEEYEEKYLSKEREEIKKKYGDPPLTIFTLITLASNEFEEAVKLAKDKKYHDAIIKYNKAIDFLSGFIKRSSNKSLKKVSAESIQECNERIEILENKLKSK